MSADKPKMALVLTGGGARAAYQVGVLQAVLELLPDQRVNPFPIICGTSAGSVNAAALASQAQNFRAAVDLLAMVWRGIHAHHVYRSDLPGIAASGARWISTLALGWMFKKAPRSLLDNAPLATLLRNKIDFSGIDRAIGSGVLEAVCVTASGYTSGESVSFFQGAGHIAPWRRAQRMGCRDRLGVDHLLASSAIPFVFPAQCIHREYFGDGSMRQLAPMSAAVHLGAERILAIGSGRLQEPEERSHQHVYPSLAQVAGHALSSIFLDSLSADIEQLDRLNEFLGKIPEEHLMNAGVDLRPIKSFVIAPSERLDQLAVRFARCLPRPVRLLLAGLGASHERDGALTSYLLFEQPFTRALLALGYEDAMERREELMDFLGL